MRNSFWKRGYLEMCRKYCPSLTLDDLQPQEAGIRAQAVHRDGTLEHDFLFAATDRTLHVCNAPSPAATSALPIGQMIAERVGTLRRQP
jgi:L-2-hydroxyglutarate oxidase